MVTGGALDLDGRHLPQLELGVRRGGVRAGIHKVRPAPRTFTSAGLEFSESG